MPHPITVIEPARSKLWTYGAGLQGATGAVLIAAQYMKRRFLFGDPAGNFSGVLVDSLMFVVAALTIITIVRMAAEAVRDLEMVQSALDLRAYSLLMVVFAAVIVWTSRVTASSEISAVLRVDAVNAPMTLNALTALYAVFFPFIVFGKYAEDAFFAAAGILVVLSTYLKWKKKESLSDVAWAFGPTLGVYAALSTAFVPTTAAERSVQIVHMLARTDASASHYCRTSKPVVYVGSDQKVAVALGQLPQVFSAPNERTEAALGVSLAAFAAETRLVECNAVDQGFYSPGVK